MRPSDGGGVKRISVWLITWMVIYDYWCERRVEAMLWWLDEWLSISQKWAERGIIAAYGICYIVDRYASAMQVVVRLGVMMTVVSMMMVIHSRAKYTRLVPRPPVLRCARIMFQILIGMLVAGLLSLHDIPQALSQILYVLFFYSIDTGSDGQRGRRRKLALGKLKELFGELTWIPKPVPE